MTLAATFEDYQSVDVSNYMLNAFKTFGTRLKRRATNQEKRDLSLAYSATNINNKEGTQVKTITVIKNLGDKNTSKLKIKPELHKSEDWANAFRDNFDSYGVIPDVPDVDDLFEYVNRKDKKVKDDKMVKMDKMDKKEGKEPEKTTVKSNTKTNEEKPVFEASSEEVAESRRSVEKIEGDAELLPNFNASRLKTRESLINFNYSTPHHSVSQYFENYIQLSPNSDKGYVYPKPCGKQQPVSSVTISTPSGRTYNIPENNTNNNLNPYLAPSVTRRPQIQQQTQPPQPSTSPPTNFPINSLLPPLQQQQPQQSNNGFGQTSQAGSPQTPSQQLNPPTGSQSNIQTQQSQQNPQSQSSVPSTSQRPYVAPNLRSNLSGVNRGPGSAPNIIVGFPNTQSGYRVNIYNSGFIRSNNARSRGLKY